MNKIISVYFNGTDEKNSIRDGKRISLATLLHAMTRTDDCNSFSICIEGCGIETKDFRDLGGIFAYHLEKQVLDVAAQVEKIIKESDPFSKTILTIYGFSRGGAAAFLLCQELKHLPIDRLEINIVAFEPVPGNFITGVYGDIFFGVNSTLSASVADLTQCKNLKNMLVLFAHGRLPDIACHAPILPAYPPGCSTEVDVTPGYHKAAVSYDLSNNAIYAENNESAIVFSRVVAFMQKCGTQFNFERFKLDPCLTPSRDELLAWYNSLARYELREDRGLRRSMHLGNTIFTAPKLSSFLNRHHQELSGVAEVRDQNSILTLEKYAPKPMTSMSKYIPLVMLLAIMLIILNKFSNDSDMENDSLPTPGM